MSALAILTSLIAVASVQATPSDPSRVAIVFPPWWTATRAVTAAAAAGTILRTGGAPFIVLVHRDRATLARGVHVAGALFTLDADPRSLCASILLDPKS